MLKKTIRRLGALAMVLAMAVSVFAVSASAAGEAEVTVYQPTGTATITKQITKEENVLAPNGNYTFTATPVNGAPADGIALSGRITSAPSATNDIGKTTVNATGAITITATAAKFPRPGTYQYKITEAAGTYADGTAYDAIEYTLDVTVARNEDDSFGIMAMILKNGTTKSEVYTNPYSPNHETQKNYVVKKVVTGNQGDKNQNFQFTFGVTNSQDNGENGKQYYYVITRRAPAANETGTIKSGDTVTTTLKHDEYVTIYGVSETDTVTANETATNADKNGYQDLGYTMTSNIVTNETTGDKTQTVTNDKAIETPGGVIMTIAPYALMVVLAGAFAVVFLSRRNRAE